jgi:hypothetical protein
MPALPLHEAGKYVAGAYVVFLVLLLIYVAIMAARLQRVDRQLAELADLAEGRSKISQDSDPKPGDTGRGAEDVAGVIPEGATR